MNNPLADLHALLDNIIHAIAEQPLTEAEIRAKLDHLGYAIRAHAEYTYFTDKE